MVVGLFALTAFALLGQALSTDGLGHVGWEHSSGLSSCKGLAANGPWQDAESH